ncbi:MAG: AAA family ATPase, partial [Pseudogulbenkiania sp.]|nr:AAA family ATPase [Pseudogulbenkiania sp.]
RAAEFARQEVSRAWNNSLTGKRAKLPGPAREPVSSAPDSPTPRQRKRLSAILAGVRPPVWLIEGVLQQGHLIAVVGQPNSGKTAVGLDLLLRIAAGKKLGNRRVKRARVVYVAAENSEEIKLRIQAWCALHETDLTELDDWFHLIDKEVFFAQSLEKETAEDLAEFAPEVAGIDTFAACFNGESENSAADVMKWFGGMREHLINPFGCAALVLHHPPKHTDNPAEWRGSGAALGTLDGVWGVACINGAVTLTQGKRRGPPFDDLHWRLHTKQMKGLKDNFGNVAESIVALPADAGAVSTGDDDIETRICAALDLGKTTYRDIAALIGSSAATISRTLPRMKKGDGTRGKLSRESQGELRLTSEGKTLAMLGRILLAGRLENPPGEG